MTSYYKRDHEIKNFWFQDNVISWNNFEIKNTKKCMTQLLSFNRKIMQTSVFRKLCRKVKIKGKREKWSKLVNLILLSKSKEIDIKNVSQHKGGRTTF